MRINPLLTRLPGAAKIGTSKIVPIFIYWENFVRNTYAFKVKTSCRNN